MYSSNGGAAGAAASSGAATVGFVAPTVLGLPGHVTLDVPQAVKTVEAKPQIDPNDGRYAVSVGSDRRKLEHVTEADNLTTNGVAQIIDGAAYY